MGTKYQLFLPKIAALPSWRGKCFNLDYLRSIKDLAGLVRRQLQEECPMNELE